MRFSGRKSSPEPLTARRLRAKAFDLLARRDHSEKELCDKLRERGAEATDLAELLVELREIGLLDDRRFARNFLTYRSGKAWGPRRYRQELLARGVAADLVDAVLSETADDPDLFPAPEEKLRSLVEKELARGRDHTKVVASLVRRGFDYAEVRDVLARCRDGSYDEHEPEPFSG